MSTHHLCRSSTFLCAISSGVLAMLGSSGSAGSSTLNSCLGWSGLVEGRSPSVWSGCVFLADDLTPLLGFFFDLKSDRSISHTVPLCCVLLSISTPSSRLPLQRSKVVCSLFPLSSELHFVFACCLMEGDVREVEGDSCGDLEGLLVSDTSLGLALDGLVLGDPELALSGL